MRACLRCAALLVMAVVSGASGAASGGVKVVWTPPGFVYPVLGWRMPVQLSDSDWRVDRALAPLDPAQYNCHYYTRLHLVERTEPARMSRWLKQPRADALTPNCLWRAGLRRLLPGEQARPGDVVLAGRLDARGEKIYSHSSVVRAVDGDGAIRSVRQKFDASRPVVDVAMDEFRMLYADLHAVEVEVWGWSLGPRNQLSRR